MQRPRKLNAPVAGYMPTIQQKQRVPVTCEVASLVNGTSGSLEIRHPSSNYTFVNHNARERPRSTHESAASPLSGLIPTRGSVITFGAHQTSHCSLGVEGIRTGEEVPVEAAASRRRSDSTQDVDEVNLRRKLTAARAECKVLSDKLQRRRADVQRARAVEAVQTEEAEQRRVAEGSCWEVRESLVLAFMSKAFRLHRGVLQRQQDSAQAQRTALEQSLASQSKAFEDEKMALQQKFRDDSDAQKRDTDAQSKLLSEIESLRRRLEEQTVIHTRECLHLETERAELQHTLLHTSTELRTKITKIAEDEFLVAQCRLFITSICHPGFSVVKDASLEPVERNRTEPTGFVLVPLTVLLHGYTLLPDTARRDVIENYEKKANA